MNLIIKKLNRAYQSYVYWSPIPVMSKTETYIFNSFVLALVTFTFYWLIVITPPIAIASFERFVYYITGHSLSIKVMLSLLILKNLFQFYTKYNESPKNNSINDGSNVKKILTLIRL
ncbi:hypothetical protein HYPBUDRAFT_190597 [Hyphopichia burtonii NRRL Y-1933]|uniref:Uncharacterized protein n=1 Tax=Hyphopichia burtonii NRRL Y-1933 TaxID=984485 RepID=A0A1E4RN65_9ASCO|nr:hypothetical protein HYPBUDRAFT_190597 [Hyphopichia burtonii NRRL Y-1933]ODV68689.1 hypothetical protein HYPBUDRAFT_190597 [Hyphopichia burtonii NRRL Y-1933]